jgi:hypothetical protein
MEAIWNFRVFLERERDIFSVKADIRRALCFPGGSTLMVSHLNKDTLMDLCSYGFQNIFLAETNTQEEKNCILPCICFKEPD